MHSTLMISVFIYGASMVLTFSDAAQSHNAPPPPEIYRKLSGIDINKLSKEIYEQELERALEETSSDSRHAKVQYDSLPFERQNRLLEALNRAEEVYNPVNRELKNEEEQPRLDEYPASNWDKAVLKSEAASRLADCESKPLLCKKIVYYLVLQKALQENNH